MKNLSEIGFYTLSNKRAKTSSLSSKLMRCELVLTNRCNFDCLYCRHVGGKDIVFSKAKKILHLWAEQGLENIRFSGGEPTLYPHILQLVSLSKSLNINRIAISTNGSAPKDLYEQLIKKGVNDFSISLDACCAEDGEKMLGGAKGAKGMWDTVVENIRWISKRVYTTVGIVLTSENQHKVCDIIYFADSLGVSDIRVIPSAQSMFDFSYFNILPEVLKKHKILKYRLDNLKKGRKVRGSPMQKCGIVLDDMAVMGDYHYPCIIYLRENGDPIGVVSDKMRIERAEWHLNHDCAKDKICSKNCLDICVDYNKKFEQFQK